MASILYIVLGVLGTGVLGWIIYALIKMVGTKEEELKNEKATREIAEKQRDNSITTVDDADKLFERMDK